MISVIVPCRNERTHIIPFLSALTAQTRHDWEAWIADGMSTDGTRHLISQDPRIHLIDNPKLSAAAGLNAAIAQSTGDIVTRMDVHTTYADDYLAQCVETLERTGADNVGGPWHARGTTYIERAIAAAFRSRFSAGGAKSHDPNYEGPVDSVYLGCWHRETLQRIGTFDESLERNQDDEWNLRLHQAGGKVWQNPHIRCWYQVRPSLRALARQYFDYGFWKVAVIRKHGRPASWRHLVPAVFLLVNLILLIVKPVAVAVTTAPYLMVSAAFSVDAARRNGWELLPVLPLVFAVYHLAYGAGFLWGCIRTIV